MTNDDGSPSGEIDENPIVLDGFVNWQFFEVFDYDLDGDNDIITITRLDYSNDIRIVRNDKNGNYTTLSSGIAFPGHDILGITTGNFNNDDLTDLAIFTASDYNQPLIIRYVFGNR